MAEEGYPDEMVVGMGTLPVTLVGNTIPWLQSRIFSTLMYEALAVLNEEMGAIELNLLESMELLDDTTVRIVIKEDIRFHNGEQLNAPRLARTFEFLKNAEPQKFTWSFRQLNDYESYEVIDDYTMEFKLIKQLMFGPISLPTTCLSHQTTWKPLVLMATLKNLWERDPISLSPGSETISSAWSVGKIIQATNQSSTQQGDLPPHARIRSACSCPPER